MRLLVVTQKVDRSDPVLGFFHGWLVEFAKRVEFLTVICLSRGEFDLPANVRVLSLGKEAGLSKAAYIARFYRYIWHYRHEYDSVFVHMNPEYVALGGLLWRWWRKRVGLWYVHRQVNPKLRIAAKLADRIFTSTRESFLLQSGKVSLMGHGVDLSAFKQTKLPDVLPRRILCIGRITLIKNITAFVETMALLNKHAPGVYEGQIVGAPASEQDKEYEDRLRKLVAKEGLAGVIKFPGPKTSAQIPGLLESAWATINLSPTGGMDKVVLESLVCGRPVFLFNRAFETVLGGWAGLFVVEDGRVAGLVSKIEDFSAREDAGSLLKQLSDKVRAEYGLENLLTSILDNLNAETSR